MDLGSARCFSVRGAVMGPAVSVITPTRGRQALLPTLHAVLAAQTVLDWEWLVFDEGPEPSPYLRQISSPKIRYLHAADHSFAIGEKRNIMVDAARAPVICHFDDDDYYAPHYLETMLGRIDDGADLVKLSGWFVYAVGRRLLGYWDCTRGDGPHWRWSRQGTDLVALTPDAARDQANRLGYGFSYVYRRALAQSVRFPPINGGEDLGFARPASTKGRYSDFPDTGALCLHLLHGRNTSLCLPQYQLPEFLVDRLFGAPARATIAACAALAGPPPGD